MNRFALTAVLCLWGTSVLSQQVAVTSGEHDGFTRLVLELDPALDWRLEDRTGIATLIVEGAPVDFDTSRVFDRISKARLGGLSTEKTGTDSRLTLQLGCPCSVKAFPYLARYIVLDISDPEMRPTARPVTAVVPSDQPPPPDMMERRTTLPPLLTPPDRMPSPLDALPAAKAETTDEVPPDMSADGTDDYAGLVEEARTRLLEQMTMASETGLIDLSEALPPADPAPAESGVEPNRESPPIETVADKPQNGSQFAVSSVFDRDKRVSGVEKNQGDQACPAESLLDIASWTPEGPFSDRLAELRGDLVLEFDRIDPQAATQIAQLYIRFGLGREARMYLDEYKDIIPDAALLAEMAFTAEGDKIPDGEILAGASGCSGLAGLWSAVATRQAGDMSEETAASIVATLSELPPDLRRLFGPRLFKVLVEAGFPELAQRTSDIIERAPGADDPFQRLISAELARDRGELAEAERLYRGLIVPRSNASLRALVELAEMRLKNDMQADRTFVADLGAAADEQRGTLDGRILRRLEVLWTAKTDGPEKSLELVERTVKKYPDSRNFFREVAVQVFSITLPRAELAEENLTAMIRYENLLGTPQQNPETFLQLATVSLEAGLPDLSIRLLQPLAQSGDDKVSILMAKSSLQSFEPVAALSILENIDNDAATILRVRSYLELGAFGSALSEIDKLKEPDRFPVLPEWYPGDWVDAANNNEAAAEIRDTFASGIDIGEPQILPDISSGPVSLEKTRAVLARGKAVEQRFSEILSE